MAPQLITPRLASLAMLLAGLTAPTPAAAQQSLRSRGLVPLEQTVEDIDPTARSLRHLQPGLWTLGQDTAVYKQKGGPIGLHRSGSDNKVLLIGRGFIAEFDRSQYIQLNDGRILQQVPPNTVFRLGLPDPEPQSHPVRDNPNRIDASIDARRQSRPARQSGFSSQADALQTAPQSDAQSEWRRYRHVAAASRRSVTDALKRVADRRPSTPDHEQTLSQPPNANPKP